MRQLECSGPAPSIPCGSSITSPDWRPHLDSPLPTNVSCVISHYRHKMGFIRCKCLSVPSAQGVMKRMYKYKVMSPLK